MSDLVFVDTNVLVYARDGSEPQKGKAARSWLRALWQERRGRISTQVLNEYYVTVTQKLDPGMSVAAARSDVKSLFAWRPSEVGREVIVGAFELQDQYSLSWWDALIVSTAGIADCRYLLTEDLQDGQVLRRLEVVDPFKRSPEHVPGG